MENISESIVKDLASLLGARWEKDKDTSLGNRWTIFYTGKISNERIVGLVHKHINRNQGFNIEGFNARGMIGTISHKGEMCGFLSIENPTPENIADIVIIATRIKLNMGQPRNLR